MERNQKLYRNAIKTDREEANKGVSGIKESVTPVTMW